MAIKLDSGTARSASVKLREIGDYIDFHVVKVEKVPRTVFGTKDPMIDEHGKTKMQEKVTVLAVGGNSKIVEDDEDVDTPTDTPVVLFLASYDRYEWYQALSDLPGGLDVGDKGRWKFERTEKSKTAGYNDRKVRSLMLRKADAADADVVARCEAAYHELADGTRISAEASEPVDTEEDPF